MMSSHTKTFGMITAVIFASSLSAMIGVLFFMNHTESVFVEKQRELQQQKVHEQELASLLQLVSRSEEERNQIESYVLGSGESAVVSFLALIESLGREQGIVLNTPSLNEAPIDGSSSFSKLEIEVTMEGPYAAVVHTISLLETLPYQSRVTGVTLGKGGDDGRVWTGSVNLEVTKLSET